MARIPACGRLDPQWHEPAANARIHARFRCPLLPQGRGDLRAKCAGIIAVRDRQRIGRGRGQSGRSLDHHSDRSRLDLRRGRPDFGPPPRGDDPRRRRHRRGRNLASRCAQAAIAGAQRQEGNRAHLDRAAIAANVRLGPQARGCRAAGRGRAGAGKARRRDHHQRRRGRQGRVHCPARLDDRREGDWRPAGVPLLPPRRFLLRRNGSDRRERPHRHRQGRDQVRSNPPAGRRLPRTARQAPRPARTRAEGHDRAARHQRLHRKPQGRVFERGRSLFANRAIPRRQRHRRSDRCAADRREAVHRLRQLRKGLRRQSRRPLAARPRGRQDLCAPARADIMPPLRTPALHGRLPAQRDQARTGRRGVHRRDLHRLRQLPEELPLRRDPHGRQAAQEAEPAAMDAVRQRPRPGRGVL